MLSSVQGKALVNEVARASVRTSMSCLLNRQVHPSPH